MRLPDNGRYGYPLIRPSTFRAFLMDQPNPKSSVSCLIDGYTLVAGPADETVPSPAGIARAGGITGPSTITEQEQYACLGDCTAHAMVKIERVSTTVLLIGYSDFGFYFTAQANRRLFFRTTNSFINSTSGCFEFGEWFVATVRKRGTQYTSSGLPASGTTSIVDLFVNGQIVATSTSFTTGSTFGINTLVFVGTDSNINNRLLMDGVFMYAEALSDDAIAEDVRRVHQLRTHCRAGLRVTVEDQNGEYRDLTDLNGVDWVTSASISDELDSPTMSATVNLVREQGNQSIAGLVTNSQLNLSNPGDVTSYTAPFIDLGRGIEIYSARVPVGIDPDGRDWFSVFKGNIDEIKESGNSVDLSCRDLGGKIIDTYIEKEYEYGSPDGIYAVEGEMQAILDDNDDLTNGVDLRPAKTGSYEPVTLYTPTTPNWAVTAWKQRREPVMSALRSLAGQIGWDVKYRFDKVSGTWRLTFFQPERESPRATMALTKDDILEVTNLSRNLLGIRNVVRVVYPSSETTLPTIPSLTAYPGFNATRDWNNVDGEGNRMTAYIEIEDTASISRVGRRLFMEVAEASGSQIDTIGEAFDFALGMLLDLNEEDLAKSIDIPLMPEMELNDLPKVMPIPELFTAPQRLAVKRLTHSFDSNGAKTTVEMRGKPAVGQKRWLRLDTRAGGGKPAVIDPAEAISDVQLGSLLGNVRNFLDRTGYFQGGKFIQIRNPNFQSWTNGIANAPDGWKVDSGTWGVDFEHSSDSVSGGHSVRLITANGSSKLLSDYIQVGALIADNFTLECSYKVTGTASPRLGILWYDENKNPVGINGLSANTPLLDPNNSLYNSRNDNAALVSYASRVSNQTTFRLTNISGAGQITKPWAVGDCVEFIVNKTDTRLSFFSRKRFITQVNSNYEFVISDPGPNATVDFGSPGTDGWYVIRRTHYWSPAFDELSSSAVLKTGVSTNTWLTDRRTEISPPENAKFARIAIDNDPKYTGGSVYVDYVSLYKQADLHRYSFGYDTSNQILGFTYSPSSPDLGAKWYLATMNPVWYPAFLNTSDSGYCLHYEPFYTNPQSSPFTKYGCTKVRKSGRYRVEASLLLEGTGVEGESAKYYASIRIVRNRIYNRINGLNEPEYGATAYVGQPPFEVLATSVDAESKSALVNPSQGTGLKDRYACPAVSAECFLSVGDRVTVEVYIRSGGDLSNIKESISTNTTAATYFQLKEISSE